MRYKQVAETLDGLEYEIRLKEHERDLVRQYLYVFTPTES